MLRIDVRNEDLTMSRFALSPLWELTQALRLLPGGSRQPDEPVVLRPWLLRALDRYRALARETDLGVIRMLSPPSWGADFLAPVPASVHTTIGDLLEAVRSTPADQAQREVAVALARQPRVDPRIERILTSDRAAGYVADVLAAAWHALLDAGPVPRRHRGPPGRAARGRAGGQGQVRALGALPPHPGRGRAGRRRALTPASARLAGGSGQGDQQHGHAGHGQPADHP